jgi:hypothetical protein
LNWRPQAHSRPAGDSRFSGYFFEARFMVRPQAMLAMLSLSVSLASHAFAAPAPPTNQTDCAAMSKALYAQAEGLSKPSKAIIPREFVRVSADLDDACDAQDFAKARISIDWMNTCLKNFTKSYKLGFCTRNKSYFCAVDPQSDGCLGQ